MVPRRQFVKKFVKFIFLFVTLFYVSPVFAIQHITSEIIPISEVATVNTDTILFYNMTYVSNVSGKDYGQFQFEYVQNNTITSNYSVYNEGISPNKIFSEVKEKILVF